MNGTKKKMASNRTIELHFKKEEKRNKSGKKTLDPTFQTFAE